MSDTTPFAHAGTEKLSPAVGYDPAAGDPLPTVREPIGPVVLLLVSTAVEREWAAATAVALSTAWARGGRRIVLADLHLEQPVLHETLGVPNLEGMVDVFLYGASIARSARPVQGGDFYLISAGTYEPDADAIYRNPRWAKLAAGFRDANASLVLFVPGGGEDLDGLAQWVSRLVLLGEPEDPRVLEPFTAFGLRPDTVLVPPGQEPPAPAYAEPEPAELAAAVPVESAPVEAPPAREGRRASVPAEPAPRSEEDRELMLPPPPHRDAPRATPNLRMVLAVLAAALMLGVLGYVLARSRPGAVPWLASGTPAEAAPAETPAAPAPTRVGEPLPYSVQVKAFASLPAAQELAAREEGRSAGTTFYVSPEEIDGVLYYKVLAGLLPDTVAAAGLRQRLLDEGAVERDDALASWSLVQTTPLAFDLGEYEHPARARIRADSLLAAQIPTYTVAIPYSDGSRRWQLYAGAYRDSASADAMRRRLAGAGLTPRLVLRLGLTRPDGAR